MKGIYRCCAAGLSLFAGCGEAGFTPRAANSVASPARVAWSPAEESSPSAAAAGQLARENEPAVVRKIVYTAEVDLVCDDFPDVVQRLESLVTASGGFVADSRLFGSSGTPRRGEWKLRLPTARFDTLLADLKRLAEVRNVHITSDDVSAEYYDVDARIRNKQQEESRLLRLLDDRTAKLEEVLSVEREISRVRGEVEQLQARLRVLANLTELATVTVRIEEVQGYRPDTEASFAVRLVRSVRQSLQTLLGASQAAAIAFAVALPWLLTLGAFLLLARAVLRRLRSARLGRT
ncbi:MAG TPA: DUF4349 domain-containing protein [Pirellulales bacterium]|nr:DUF4349 domain-containing protein [Pirellulales bacterium]